MTSAPSGVDLWFTFPFSVFIPPFISKRCSTIPRSCTSSYLIRFTKFSVLTSSNLLSLGNSNEFDCSRLLADFTFPFTLSLCDLCVSKDNQRFIFHAESAKSAKFYFPLCFTLALEWSQTSLRQKCAESFIHPLPPAGYSHLSQGEKVGDSVRAVVTNCPSETGGRGA